MARKVIVGGVGKSPSIDKINAALQAVDGASGGGGSSVDNTNGFSHMYARELGTISRSLANYVPVPIDFKVGTLSGAMAREYSGSTTLSTNESTRTALHSRQES